MENIITGKPINLTIESLEQFSKITSNDYLMLCEFIDNSISSFISNRFKNNSTTQGLKILLEIDKSKSSKNFRIFDNANGMSPETLVDALWFGSRKGIREKDTPLNAFGVGMKQGAFFLGRGIEIKTKLKKDSIISSTIVDIDEIEVSGRNEIVPIVHQKSGDGIFFLGQNFDSGTEITIRHIRSNRLTNAKTKKLVINLGIRYSEYIKSGLDLQIRFLDGKNDEVIKIYEYNPLLENPYESITILNKMEKLKHNTATFTANLREAISDHINENALETDESVMDFYNKIRNKEDLKWDINENFMDTELKVEGYIGILKEYHSITENDSDGKKIKQAYTQYNGFSIFQAGRAIFCSPNIKQSGGENNVGLSNYFVGSINAELSGGKTHVRRWVGKINIDAIYNAVDVNGKHKYLELNSNKSGITWLDTNYAKAFDSILENIMTKYDKILELYHKYEISYIKKDVKDVGKNGVKTEFMNSSTNSNFVRPDFEDPGLENADNKYTYKINISNGDQLIPIVISHIDDSSNHKVLNYEYNDEKEFVSMEVNIQCLFWNPLIGEEITLSNIVQLHKFAIAMGLTEIFISKDKLYEKFKNSVFKKIIESHRSMVKENKVAQLFSFFANNISME